jgi:catechol 2,3-dioxygenase-like lactoylglutathione lyase family enzyme
MIRTLLIFALTLFSYPVFGQPFSLQFDHATILVEDLERSANFYRNILQFEELETPWGINPSIRFFSIGGNQQLHVAQIENDGVKLNKVIHIAFAVQDFETFLGYLKEKGIEYGNFAADSDEPQTRPDGVKQVYLQDPDGYWIEINNAAY